jgi:hypothetical protein
MITKPGIYYDIQAEVYHADPCPTPSLNQTLAKVLLEQSPAHAFVAHPKLSRMSSLLDEGEEQKEKYVAARAIGNAAHAQLLGRSRVVNVLDFSDFKKKDAQAARDAAFALGEIPILRHHHEAAEVMVKRARQQLDAHQDKNAFTDGRAEVVLAWEEDGVWLRSMVDWLGNDLVRVDDLKTTGNSAAPDAVPSKLWDDGWDVQAAMIERGLNRLDPANAGRRRFRYICLENYPPFGLTSNRLSESVLTVGRRKLDWAIKVFRRCLESNDWPAYGPLAFYPEAPGYKLAAWEDRERELMEALS